jgi:hypothetical protein
LSSWTKSSLAKLSYFFKLVPYIRGQVVYNEGEDSSKVMIVKEGEFEVTKKIMVIK